MRERISCVDAVGAGVARSAGPVALLPIERTSVHAIQRAGHHRCWASKEPLALIVHDGLEIRAFGADGAALSARAFEALRRQVPQLDAALARLPALADPTGSPVGSAAATVAPLNAVPPSDARAQPRIDVADSQGQTSKSKVPK